MTVENLDVDDIRQRATRELVVVIEEEWELS